MGALIDQLCAACEIWMEASSSEHSILPSIMVMTGRSYFLAPEIQYHPSLLTVEAVHRALEAILEESHMEEDFLVVAIIRAVDDELERRSEDYAKGLRRLRQATENLIRQGEMTDPDEIARMREAGQPSLEKQRLARLDLDAWREATHPILDEQNLDRVRIGRLNQMRRRLEGDGGISDN